MAETSPHEIPKRTPEVTPLIGQTISVLNWSNSPFNYPKMMRIHASPDGSCFFHAIINAFHKPYKTGLSGGKPLDRNNFIRSLRMDLAMKLGERIDITDPESKTYYDTLSRGQLAEIAKNVSNLEDDNGKKLNDCEYSLESMQKELRSTQAVDNVYYEFISNVLNKDIHVLNLVKGDVEVIGDDELLYKGRDSIVILFMPGHYDLVGILNSDNSVSTLFSPDNEFIEAINNRRHQLRELGSRIAIRK